MPLHKWRSSIAVTLMLLLFSSILFTNLVSGQVFPKSNAGLPITSSKSSSAFSLIKYPTAHNVRITSPSKGERVRIGENLVISGISVGNSNATSINCHVSVIVNGIKPYPTATASGPSGSGDYSKWRFTLIPTSEYTAIKAGQNKITAEYSCANSPTSLSHYSVNVTGINISMGNITRVK